MKGRFAIIIILLISFIGCTTSQTIERHSVVSTVSSSLNTADSTIDIQNYTRIEDGTTVIIGTIGGNLTGTRGTNNTTSNSTSSMNAEVSDANDSSSGENYTSPVAIELSEEDTVEYIDALSGNDAPDVQPDNTGENLTEDLPADDINAKDYESADAKTDQESSVMISGNFTDISEGNYTATTGDNYTNTENYTGTYDANSTDAEDNSDDALEESDTGKENATDTVDSIDTTDGIDITDGDFVDVSEGDYTNPTEENNTSSDDTNIENYTDTYDANSTDAQDNSDDAQDEDNSSASGTEPQDEAVSTLQADDSLEEDYEATDVNAGENVDTTDGIDITDGDFVDVSEGDYTNPPEGSHTSSGDDDGSVVIGDWNDGDIIDINDTEVDVDNGTTDLNTTDGEDISINGTESEDSSGEGALPPSYNPPSANNTDPDTINRVPNYITPPVNTTIEPGSDEQDDEADEIAKKKASERESTLFNFEMSGFVKGNGSYNEWRSMKDSGGGKVKQYSGAQEGELELERLDMAVGEADTYYSSWAMLTRSYVRFIGDQYRERDLYTSQGEYIRESYQTEAIRKQSNYIDFREFVLPEHEWGVPDEWRTNITKTYSMDVRYVGTGSFSSKFANSSATSDYYSGQFSISRRLSSYNTYRLWQDNSTWAPCCNWSAADAPALPAYL